MKILQIFVQDKRNINEFLIKVLEITEAKCIKKKSMRKSIWFIIVFHGLYEKN
jgi:hypothetical protein